MSGDQDDEESVRGPARFLERQHLKLNGLH